MASHPRLSPTAVRTLAEIAVTGLWLWTSPVKYSSGAAFLDDPQRSPLRPTTVLTLVRHGYLVESDDTVDLTDWGRERLDREHEAVSRAEALHAVQQQIHATTGKSASRRRGPEAKRPTATAHPFQVGEFRLVVYAIEWGDDTTAAACAAFIEARLTQLHSTDPVQLSTTYARLARGVYDAFLDELLGEAMSSYAGGPTAELELRTAAR